MQLHRDIKSFTKTLKAFDKLVQKTRSNQVKSKSGRRLKKAAIAAFAAVIIIFVMAPPFIFPAKGEVSSGFFLRQRPESMFMLDLETHRGIDLAAPSGTRVVAAAPGVVSAAGFSESYGNYVSIRHLFGFETYYAHLSEISVSKGKLIIIRGTRKIGEVGSTGRSTGPHLHFELRLFGRYLPPRFFLIFHGIRRQLLRF